MRHAQEVLNVFVAEIRPTMLDSRHPRLPGIATNPSGNIRASLDSSPKNERRVHYIRLRFPHLEGLLHMFLPQSPVFLIDHPRIAPAACHSQASAIHHLFIRQGLIDTHRARFSQTLCPSICAEVRSRLRLAIGSHNNPFWSSSDHRGTPEVG